MAVLSLLFLLSGFSALFYQIVWLPVICTAPSSRHLDISTLRGDVRWHVDN